MDRAQAQGRMGQGYKEGGEVTSSEKNKGDEIMNSSIAVESIVKFGELLKKGLECIKEACQIFVKTIDENPESLEKFKEKYDLTETAWVRFEQVGRGLLHEKLLTDYSVGARKLKRLPFSQQAKYSAEPIPVLINGGDILKVQLANLTPAQCKQVFDEDHVRSPAEQRAYIETQKNMPFKEVTNVPFIVKNSRLIIKEKDIAFTVKQLKKIISEMEK